VGFLVGDVASRGVSAALAVAVTQTFVRGFAAQGSVPGECLASLNRVVLSEGFPNVSMTIFFANLDLDTGAMSYCNAGHLAPLIVSALGVATTLDGPADLPIWLDRDHAYDTRIRQLERGDEVFLFSDGLPETTDRYGHRFTVERLKNVLARRHGSPAPEIIRSVVRDVSDFSEGVTQSDDYAALAVRYMGPAAS
jgi:sigma-B regulation protein RsbU (phosphoserine phosphatase)